MSAVSHALRPNPVERALRSGVILYVVVLVAVPLVGLVQFGLADGLATFWARAMSPVARAALWLTLWSALLVGGINTLFADAGLVDLLRKHNLIKRPELAGDFQFDPIPSGDHSQ